MGLFSRTTEGIEEERESRRSEGLIRNLILFPGSVAEYSSFVGYEVEIVDNLERDKGIEVYSDLSECPSHYRDFVASLIKSNNIEALVNVTFKSTGSNVETHSNAYGLPVRRKK